MKAGAIASSSLVTLGRILQGDGAALRTQGANWVDLIRTANDEFVTPALFHRLRDGSASGGVSGAEPEAMAYLGEIDTLNCQRNLSLWALVSEVTALLNEAGIVPTLIKGASEMALQGDPSSFYRLMIDVDMVVDRSEAGRAQDLLVAAGFELLEDSTYAHSPGCFWKAGYAGTLDLHAGLQRDIARFLSDGDWQARRVLRERDGLQFYVPDPSFRLLINVSHDMLHHSGLARGGISLRYLLPLWRQLQDDTDLDWPWLLKLRRDPRFRLAFDLQMLMLQELFGLQRMLPFHVPRRTALLHRRRMLKLRYPRLGDLEWSLVKPIYTRLNRLPSA